MHNLSAIAIHETYRSIVNLAFHWCEGHELRPILPEILGESDPLLQNGDFQSIFARSASTVTPGEKTSFITNRKFTTGLPMSLR